MYELVITDSAQHRVSRGSYAPAGETDQWLENWLFFPRTQVQFPAQ